MDVQPSFHPFILPRELESISADIGRDGEYTLLRLPVNHTAEGFDNNGQWHVLIKHLLMFRKGNGGMYKYTSQIIIVQ